MDLFGHEESKEAQPQKGKAPTRRVMVPLGDVIHRPFSITRVSKTEVIIWNEGPARLLDRNGR